MKFITRAKNTSMFSAVHNVNKAFTSKFTADKHHHRRKSQNASPSDVFYCEDSNAELLYVELANLHEKLQHIFYAGFGAIRLSCYSTRIYVTYVKEY